MRTQRVPEKHLKGEQGGTTGLRKTPCGRSRDGQQNAKVQLGAGTGRRQERTSERETQGSRARHPGQSVQVEAEREFATVGNPNQA